MKEFFSQEVISQVLKISALSAFSFIAAIGATPLFTYFAYKRQFWKKMRSNASLGSKGEETPVYNSLHEKKHKRNIPTGAV
jgi:hypothetical protein